MSETGTDIGPRQTDTRKKEVSDEADTMNGSSTVVEAEDAFHTSDVAPVRGNLQWEEHIDQETSVGNGHQIPIATTASRVSNAEEGSRGLHLPLRRGNEVGLLRKTRLIV